MPVGLRPVARQLATAPVVLLPVGEQALQTWYAEDLHGPGLLVLRGLVAREAHMCGRTATELLGPGDLLRPWDVEHDDPVMAEVVWRVLAEAELAILDDEFSERMRRWPELANELLAREVHRSHALATQRAIASHPRVDMRVAMLLWHLAGRYGRVQGDGSIRIDLPLTHRLIGELVGAERPSVSHAFARLGKAGLIDRTEDGWLLHGTPADHEEAALRPLPPH